MSPVGRSYKMWHRFSAPKPALLARPHRNPKAVDQGAGSCGGLGVGPYVTVSPPRRRPPCMGCCLEGIQSRIPSFALPDPAQPCIPLTHSITSTRLALLCPFQESFQKLRASPCSESNPQNCSRGQNTQQIESKSTFPPQNDSGTCTSEWPAANLVTSLTAVDGTAMTFKLGEGQSHGSVSRFWLAEESEELQGNLDWRSRSQTGSALDLTWTGPDQNQKTLSMAHCFHGNRVETCFSWAPVTGCDDPRPPLGGSESSRTASGDGIQSCIPNRLHPASVSSYTSVKTNAQVKLF